MDLHARGRVVFCSSSSLQAGVYGLVFEPFHIVDIVIRQLTRGQPLSFPLVRIQTYARRENIRRMRGGE
jgi:hypothetical protein